jgi:hypothetical protein
LKLTLTKEYRFEAVKVKVVPPSAGPDEGLIAEITGASKYIPPSSSEEFWFPAAIIKLNGPAAKSEGILQFN